MGTIADATLLGGGPVGGQGYPSIPFSGQTFAGTAAGQPDVPNANAVGQEASDNLSSQGQIARAQAASQPTFHKLEYTTDANGNQNISVKMPKQTFDTLTQLMQTGQATISAFGAAREQLARKQKFLQDNPIIAGLGSIASTAAAGYATGGYGQSGRIAPLVRAAGAYGLSQFGQTPDELQLEQAQISGQEFGVANQLYNQDQQDRTLKAAEARTASQDALDNKRYGTTQIAQLRQSARQGLYGAEDIQGLTDEIVQSGFMSQETAGTFAKSLVAESEAKKRIVAAEDKAKLDAEERRQLESDKRFALIQSGINSRFNEAKSDRDEKKAEAEADTLLLAQGIVNGDPTSLNLWTTRTGGRAHALATVQRLDPSGNWNETKINTRAKAWVDLADQQKTGSLGTQLAMYDTFLQHTDELDKLTKQLGGTNSPLLNRPLNKLRAEAAGNPILFRWLVVASAVGKEYEGVLLRGRALYADDRQEVDRMLNYNIPGKVLLQTTNQQRKVAADRVNSAGTSFQRTTGRELPNDSISDASKAILEKNGIRVPIEGTPGSKSGAAPNAPAASGAAPVLPDEFKKKAAAAGPGKGVVYGGWIYDGNGNPVAKAQ